jgi:uncharacterized SAM-binding protein YcdF (DUF218 family)
VKRALKIALAIVAAFFLTIFVYLSVVFAQVYMAAHRDDAKPSDAIVVLGAAQYNGRPSPVLKARLDHTILLYDKHIAPRIVLTGGKQPGDKYTEASAGFIYLRDHGIPASRMLLETMSQTSWQSLEAASRILKDRGLDHVVLVSDPYHMARIEDLAHEFGLHAVTSPTRTSPIRGWGEWRRMFGETLRVAAGRIFGYGRLDRHRQQVEKLVPGLGIATLAPPLRRPRSRRGARSGMV